MQTTPQQRIIAEQVQRVSRLNDALLAAGHKGAGRSAGCRLLV
jgi:hypothetical protein